MKKSLLALAVLSAFAGAASAQSSVTLSGIVDAGIRRQGTATGNDWNMSGSQSGYNAFTLSGREDLGGGMYAFFALNHRFRINDGTVNSAGATFWRNTAVGLGGGFGDVRLGRILMPLQDMNGGFDPFATGTVGTTHTGGITATIRANNAIYFRSANLGGLTVHAAIAAGEGQLQAENANNFSQTVGAATVNQERPVGFNVRYAAGPLNVGVAYDRNSSDYKTTAAYASFDFGSFKLMGQFEDGESDIGGNVLLHEDVKNMSIGATIPLGAILVRTGYVRVNSDLSGRDGSKFGFGGDYNLSKRTNLYATVGKWSGDRFSVAQKKTQFDVGVTHRF